MKTTRIFIAASGTDVGKTFASRLLLAAWRDNGAEPIPLKPVASGFDWATAGESDAGLLLAAAGMVNDPEQVAAISPWRYRLAASPPHAADAEGEHLDFDAVLAWCRGREAHPGSLLLESAGGLCSPLSHDRLMLDLAVALGWPMLLIGGTELGGIGHLLAAERAAIAAGIRPLGLLVSESKAPGLPLEQHGKAIARLAATGAPFLLPRLDLDAPGGTNHAARIGRELARWLEARA